MANPAPDYPAAIHTPLDISAKANVPLGTSPNKHTQVHGKIEEEIAAIQRKLGILESNAEDATTGQVLTKQEDGSTIWADPQGGGASLEIGSPVTASTPLRLLSTDSDGNLTDEVWGAEIGNVFGILDYSSLSSPLVPGIAIVMADTTPVGGTKAIGFSGQSGAGISLGLSDFDTFNSYWNIIKNASNEALFQFSPYGSNVSTDGNFTISSAGVQLSNTGATVAMFDSDDTLSANSNSRVPTQQAVKAYIDNNGGGGGISSVGAGDGITVDNTDPDNPVVALDGTSLASLLLADSAMQPGDAVSALSNDANYVTSSALSSYLPKSGGTMTGSLIFEYGFITIKREAMTTSYAAIVQYQTGADLKWSHGIFRGDDDWRLWKSGSTTDIIRVEHTTEKVYISGLRLIDLTAARIAYVDSNKELKALNTSTYPSLTELSYVKGVTSSIQAQFANFGGGVLLSNSRAGTALSLFAPGNGSASATAYSPGNMIIWGFSGLGIQNIEALQVNVTATSLAAGEYVTICVYEALANGGPGTLLWSENIVCATTGDKTIGGLSGRTRPAKGWIAVLNPSGNSGSVTLSRYLPSPFNNALVNAAGVGGARLKTGVASPPDLTSEVMTVDHTGVPIVRARP